MAFHSIEKPFAVEHLTNEEFISMVYAVAHSSKAHVQGQVFEGKGEFALPTLRLFYDHIAQPDARADAIMLTVIAADMYHKPPEQQPETRPTTLDKTLLKDLLKIMPNQMLECWDMGGNPSVQVEQEGKITGSCDIEVKPPPRPTPRRGNARVRT